MDFLVYWMVDRVYYGIVLGLGFWLVYVTLAVNLSLTYLFTLARGLHFQDSEKCVVCPRKVEGRP